MENNNSKTSDKEKTGKAILTGAEEALYKIRNDYDNLEEKASETLKEIRGKASDIQKRTKEKIEVSKEMIEEYVREHPEKSLLIAAGIGALAALIAVGITRRRRD